MPKDRRGKRDRNENHPPKNKKGSGKKSSNQNASPKAKNSPQPPQLRLPDEIDVTTINPQKDYDTRVYLCRKNPYQRLGISAVINGEKFIIEDNNRKERQEERTNFFKYHSHLQRSRRRTNWKRGQNIPSFKKANRRFYRWQSKWKRQNAYLQRYEYREILTQSPSSSRPKTDAAKLPRSETTQSNRGNTGEDKQKGGPTKYICKEHSFEVFGLHFWKMHLTTFHDGMSGLSCSHTFSGDIKIRNTSHDSKRGSLHITSLGMPDTGQKHYERTNKKTKNMREI